MNLILLNYELEDMSGEEFAQRLSKIRPAAVLIVLDSREKIFRAYGEYPTICSILCHQTIRDQ